ncbi:type I DNA topoisomerase [Mycoplasmopsis sturni]|uniref:type I DNA topoisomerase n=1 Tax=Mycoplasmopsis sturni TaxID=39047 RepID=UPI00055A756D|nr:type I DNA topoisomerase [Mycoplasmopsis sturni]
MNNKKSVVIVESPNKVNTIKKYLGDSYDVVASVGHIWEMQSTGLYRLGIDLEKWEPKYKLAKGKSEVVKKLKESVKGAEKVYIATDPDREGEAIGDHLVQALKLNNYSRIKYNEITKEAILRAISHPGELDLNLIDAQKSRRMLDRIIGYRLSSLMKEKIKNSPNSPSAGRVQSIALKLVVDRENEIRSFVPEYYSKLSAIFEDQRYFANYFNLENGSEKQDWILPNEVEQLKEYFDKANKELVVTDIKTSERKVSQVQPFKQSALYRKSPYNAKNTQVIAQKLYEGYGEGGLISYPRTDSTRLSQSFIDEAQVFIKNKWGQDYVASEVKGFSGDQDAHEAIRPTDINLDPELARTTYPQMSETEYRVYKLIYEVTLQSLIKQPIRTSTQYTYFNGEYGFKNSFSKVKFLGYYVVTGYTEDLPDPEFVLNQKIKIAEFKFEDHQTKPAPRYTEGALIEALDNIKVGRPSTFATTVNTIKEREYVIVEDGSLKPTNFGEIVLEKLIGSFPTIINESYTAEVEEQLDQIAEDKLNKNKVMEDFWIKFNESFSEAKTTMEATKIEQVTLDEPCPDCGGVLLERRNKKGQKFGGCKNFPNCTFTKSLPNQKSFKFYRKNNQNETKPAE